MKDPYICYRTSCRYHAGRVDGGVPSCNYFFITGRTKTSLGEADITRRCGLYAPGERATPDKQLIAVSAKSPPRRKKPVVPRKEDLRRRTGGKRYDWAQFRALYDEGYTDRAIAKEIGCYSDTVRNWRIGAGLPPHPHKDRIEPETLRRLWGAGMNDTQIAERLGTSRQAVQKSRTRLGLPAHNPQNSHGRVKT